jgi:hypothetical protein
VNAGVSPIEGVPGLTLFCAAIRGHSAKNSGEPRGGARAFRRDNSRHSVLSPAAVWNELNALEMQHRCKPIGGSNPYLSASKALNLKEKIYFHEQGRHFRRLAAVVARVGH